MKKQEGRIVEEDIVSIIAPAYNHERYVLECLESIRKQSYRNKQLIVLDDCSSDNTVSIIENYIADENVKKCFPAGIKFIKHATNMNAHNTINEGISIADGKYISVINTDDCYEENRLEVMLAAIYKSNSRLAFSKVRCIDENSKNIINQNFENMKEILQGYPSASFALAECNVAIGTGNFVFERELYYEVGGFSTEYHFIHDWDFILKVSLLTEPIFTDKTSYLYRFHSSNTIKQIDQNKESEEKKDKEVKKVLKTFVKSILNGNAQNEIFKDVSVWNYFFSSVSHCYCGVIWKSVMDKMGITIS